MKQSLIRRYALLVGSLIIALYALAPSFWPPGEAPGYFMSDGLKLGLDLQGGIHLTLEVQVEEAVLRSAQSRAHEIRSRLKEDGIQTIGEPSVVMKNGVSMITLEFKSNEERERSRRLLDEQYGRIHLESAADSDQSLLVWGDQVEMNYLRSNAVDRALEIIRNRIDQFGVAEPVLLREGEDRIVLQLPGLKEEKQAIKLIQQAAVLEFKIVHERNDELSGWISQVSENLSDNPTEDEYRKALAGKIPKGAEVSFLAPVADQEFDEGENQVREERLQPILLRARTELTGEAVTDAMVQRDPQTNEPYVHIRLGPAAARIFEELTDANVNNQLAIVLDGKVKSHPNIQEKIGGGQVRITGSFTADEAANLALVLRSGALPAPIKVIQNITVGASLGDDSIRAGLLSGILGFLIVCIFMAWYYRLSGWIADGALMLNNILLLGSLSILDATLTLPGIAGVVLSMGMAVDSNVLIFERIREELDMGRPIPGSIRAGFDKAWWTIIDSHVTTLITALVLFTFGTGPIKGFAVTLSIGVSLNLFTALLGTKVVYDHLLIKSAIKRLKFRQIIQRPNLDFIKARKSAFALSVVLVLLGFFSLVQIERGKGNLGIDFKGGTMITMGTGDEMSTGDARSALADGGFDEAEVQTAEGQGRVLIRLPQAEEEPGQLTEPILAAFEKRFPEREFKIEAATVIGGAISKDLRNASIFAVLVSLVGIIFYLTVRFDLRFGVAACVATFHDVLIVLAFFYAVGKQIDLLLVTALLTLAGYSLTDTVVVFDRIRETRNRHSSMPFKDVINKAVNEVLSRTIITSATALFVLVALYLFGGMVLRDFSLALILGILIGNYSSIFVASPIIYVWEQKYGPIVEEEYRPTRSPSKAKARV